MRNKFVWLIAIVVILVFLGSVQYGWFREDRPEQDMATSTPVAAEESSAGVLQQGQGEKASGLTATRGVRVAQQQTPEHQPKPTATLVPPPTPMVTTSVSPEGWWRCWFYKGGNFSQENLVRVEDSDSLFNDWGSLFRVDEIGQLPARASSVDCISSMEFQADLYSVLIRTDDENVISTVGEARIALKRSDPREFVGKFLVEEPGIKEVRVRYRHNDGDGPYGKMAFLKLLSIEPVQEQSTPTPIPTPTATPTPVPTATPVMTPTVTPTPTSMATPTSVPPTPVAPPIQPGSSILPGEEEGWGISILNNDAFARAQQGSVDVKFIKNGRSVNLGKNVSVEIRTPELRREGERFDVPLRGVMAHILVSAGAGVQEQCFDKIIATYEDERGRETDYELVRNFCIARSIQVQSVLSNKTVDANIINTARVNQFVRLEVECPFAVSNVSFYIALHNEEIKKGEKFLLSQGRGSLVKAIVVPRISADENRFGSCRLTAASTN